MDAPNAAAHITHVAKCAQAVRVIEDEIANSKANLKVANLAFRGALLDLETYATKQLAFDLT